VGFNPSPLHQLITQTMISKPKKSTFTLKNDLVGYSYGANIQGIIPVILEPQDEIEIDQ